MHITYAVCIPLLQEPSDYLTHLFSGEGKELQKENHLSGKMLIDQAEKKKDGHTQVLNKEKGRVAK